MVGTFHAGLRSSLAAKGAGAVGLVALADLLLRPLAAWTGKSPKSNLDSEPPPAPRPEPVPAPAPAPAAG